MKKLLWTGILLVGAFISCKKDNYLLEKEASKPKVYKLIEVYNSWTNISTAPGYEETITFYADSTFEKQRVDGAQKLTADGRYSLKTHDNGQYYKLYFNTESSITIRETWLTIQASGILVFDQTYVDGPRLKYKLQ